jgi:hypothetical protein
VTPPLVPTGTLQVRLPLMSGDLFDTRDAAKAEAERLLARFVERITV